MTANTYPIHEQTLAIVPTKQLDYGSLVMERQSPAYLRKTPMQLVKQACLDHWATYDGRRQAVMQHLGIQRKVPIPISPEKGIYLFPTKSPQHADNCWISCQHIASIEKTQTANPHASIIYFTNGQNLPVHVSSRVLHGQMQRTLWCMYHIRHGTKSIPFHP